MNNTVRKIVARYDGLLTISVGNSRKSVNWKSKSLSWSNLVQKLSQTTYTSERRADFLKMSKIKQDEIKDIGGFVGGVINGKHRRADLMGDRQLVTLDADYAAPDFWDMVTMFFGHACCLYSTHKHCPEKPRLRLVIPLDRNVSPDEYQAISRKIADNIGMDYFDDTTYQPHRLMYWPSTSVDGDFYFKFQDATWLSADSVLAEYEDWTDQTQWAVSSRMPSLINKCIKKQEDPLEKKGIVGAFCRTYSISEAIDTFLSHIYEPCRDEGRYTFTAGSSVGGAVVYEDKWLYSHHATDPCTMQLCNSFDLVRIHMFGDMDEDKDNSNTKNLPSFKAMCEFASENDKVKVTLAKERMEEAGRDFSVIKNDDNEDDIEPDMSWTSKLKCSEKTGAILPTRANYILILENDPAFKGTFGMDEFSRRITIKKKTDWHYDKTSRYLTDDDGCAIREIIESYYGIDSRVRFDDAITVAANHNRFHTVKDWLNGLKWDGVKRMDNLFIDYLGAENNEYVKAVTRKMLIAAVARVYKPGIKYDSMVVLEGPQGLGKSYILKKLGGAWFSDSLSAIQGKEGYEQLRGVWIVEMAELATMRKSEVESIKLFLSKQIDTYRVAYGRTLTDFPRQCIFVGTTNENSFLRDRTGNRRFLPIRCGVSDADKSLWGASIDEEIQQVWAEAVNAFKSGEKLILENELAEVAKQEQKCRVEDNPLEGAILEYLKKPVPKNWYKLDIQTRREYIQGDSFDVDMEGSFTRTRICPIEVWCELLKGDFRNFKPADRREIREILDTLEGWEIYKNGYHRLSFGKDYGQQRSYILKGSPENS